MNKKKNKLMHTQTLMNILSKNQIVKVDLKVDIGKA